MRLQSCPKHGPFEGDYCAVFETDEVNYEAIGVCGFGEAQQARIPTVSPSRPARRSPIVRKTPAREQAKMLAELEALLSSGFVCGCELHRFGSEGEIELVHSGCRVLARADAIENEAPPGHSHTEPV